MADKSTPFEDFLGTYNEIDHHLRKNYTHDKYADHAFLIDQLSRKEPAIARHAQELRAFAQLRNALVHNPFMRIAHPLATPNPKIVAEYARIRNAILRPPTAMSIAVPASQLYTTTLSTNAYEVMHEMKEHTYTHVPVMKDGLMIGIFSENTILAYLVGQGESIITKDLTIADFEEFIGLDKHPNEDYAFLSRTAKLQDVYQVFNDAIKTRTRIGVLFLTEHGSSREKVLGIITAWDLAQPEFGAGEH